MLRNENALANSSYVGYTSPNKYVSDELELTEYEGNEAYAPEFGYEKNEAFRYQETVIKALFADLWTKVKAY